MAIFKPSNANPSLSEIDVEEDNDFTMQNNTSGETAKATKFTVYSARGDKELYTVAANLSTPVRNKATITIEGNATEFANAGIVNDTDYQWTARVYNQELGSTSQPNTLVCEGYITGSTKSVIWSQIPANANAALDPIKYDRYIEFTVSNGMTDMILSAKDADDVSLPNGTYTERQKIDWVTKELGYNEDFVKIETEDAFAYNYPDGTSYSIYQCSDEHTVNSFFADPNTNINVANWVMVYDTPANALAAFTAGENPGTGTYTITPVFLPRKITGYSSDTGEVRVQDAFANAPINGQAYRIFTQDVSTKVYTEIFTSDVNFQVASGTTYYGTAVNASSGSPVTYYKDSSLSTSAGSLTTNTTCTFYNTTASTITLGSSTYYIATPNGGTTSTSYTATNVCENSGTIVINNVTYAVPFSSLTPYYGDTVITDTGSIFAYQVVGGKAIQNSTYYVVYSNKWYEDSEDESNTVKRLFIQPNVNIKSDDTNPNEIVFSNGCRIDINKITANNPTTGKEYDATFEKLDNTQWLLEGNAISYADANYPLPVDDNGHIQTQTDYKIYTDFMDLMPNEIFYARSTPTVTIYYQNTGSLSTSSESVTSLEGCTTTGVDYILTESWHSSETELTYDPGTYIFTGLDGVLWELAQQELEEWDGPNGIGVYNTRDMTFTISLGDDAQQAVKFVKYDLYYRGTAYSSPKSLMISSDDIYEADGAWTYRGFMKGIFYCLDVTVTDEYGATFTASHTFKINYVIDTSVDTPIDIEYDCNDKSLEVTVAAPILAVSSDYELDDETLTTVTDSNINRTTEKLSIPEGYGLNYQYLSDGETEIDITEDFTFLTRFNITGDFLFSIPTPGTKNLMSIAYRATNPLYEEGEDEEDDQYAFGSFEFVIGSGIKYYVENNAVTENEQLFKIYLYHTVPNGTTLPNGTTVTEDTTYQVEDWYYDSDGNTSSYIDLSELIGTNNLFIPNGIAYALQPNGGNGGYYLTDTLYGCNAPNTIYVLTKDYTANSVIYYKGAYQYTGDSDALWSGVNAVDYFYLDYLSTASSITANFANGALANGNTLLYADEVTYNGANTATEVLWVDSSAVYTLNSDVFDDSWYILRLVYANGIPTVEFELDS